MAWCFLLSVHPLAALSTKTPSQPEHPPSQNTDHPGIVQMVDKFERMSQLFLVRGCHTPGLVRHSLCLLAAVRRLLRSPLPPCPAQVFELCHGGELFEPIADSSVTLSERQSARIVRASCAARAPARPSASPAGPPLADAGVLRHECLGRQPSPAHPSPPARWSSFAPELAALAAAGALSHPPPPPTASFAALSRSARFSRRCATSTTSV